MLGSMKVVGAVGAASVALAALYWRRRVMPIGPCAADGRPLPSGDQQVMLSGNGLTRYHLNIRWLKEGECIVVLIHGMTSPGVDVWRPLIACLEARRRCVLAYDVAGRGWSHCAGGPMTIGYHVRQLEELLDTLSIGDRPLELVGLSFGAVIASNFAVRHRDRVRRLVMIAPAGLFPPRDYLGLLAGSGLLGLLARVRWAARCRASLKRDYARELRAMTDGGAVLRAYIANADCNRAIVRSCLCTYAQLFLFIPAPLSSSLTGALLPLDPPLLRRGLRQPPRPPRARQLLLPDAPPLCREGQCDRPAARRRRAPRAAADRLLAQTRRAWAGPRDAPHAPPPRRAADSRLCRERRVESHRDFKERR